MDHLVFTPSDATWSTSLVFADDQPELSLDASQSAAVHAPFGSPATNGPFDDAPNIFERSTVPADTSLSTHINLDQNGFMTTGSMPQYRPSSSGVNALCCAARCGDTQGVLSQLQQGCDLNAWDFGEVPCTPLIAAVENGHSDVAKALLRAGADVNLGNGQGRSPLYCAAQRGNLDMVALLLRQPGIQSGAVMKDGTTPFQQAAGGGHVAVARILMEVDIVPTALRRQCLADACRRGDAAMVTLLDCGDMQADAAHRASCLHIAAGCGHAVVVAFLLRNGVAATAGDDGLTPLQRACLNGHAGVVEVLLAQTGVHVDDPGLSAPPLLYLAANAGHGALVQYLLDAGATPNSTDARTGRTALMAATAAGHQGVLKALLACGRVDLELTCHSGWTALQLAMFSGTREGVICLLNAGAAVEMPNDYNYRRSLLWRAINRKDGEMVRLMLAHGSTRSQTPSLCQAAVAHAAECGCADIVENLLDAGHRGPEPEGLVRHINAASTRGRRTPSASAMDPPIDSASAVAICDMPLVRTPPHGLWPSTASSSAPDACGARLQMFHHLMAPLNVPASLAVNLRENLLLHLHKNRLLLATALPLADCFLCAVKVLKRVSGTGQANSAFQIAAYCAAAASVLDLRQHKASAAAIYSRANISTPGQTRLTGAVQGQLIHLKNLASEASVMLGEQMLAKIMPACFRQVDGRSPVDTASLVTELVACGLLRPLAQIVAAGWKDAVAWLLAAPLEIPPGSSFFQVRQRMDDAMARLGKSHLAPAILAALREVDARSALLEASTTAPGGEVLLVLLQIQTAQLRRYAERMQQG